MTVLDVSQAISQVSVRIVHIDDQAEIRKRVRRQLGCATVKVTSCSGRTELRKQLSDGHCFDLCLLDVRFASVTTMIQLVELLRQERPDLPIALLTQWPEDAAITDAQQDYGEMDVIDKADVRTGAKLREVVRQLIADRFPADAEHEWAQLDELERYVTEEAHPPEGDYQDIEVLLHGYVEACIDEEWVTVSAWNAWAERPEPERRLMLPRRLFGEGTFAVGEQVIYTVVWEGHMLVTRVEVGEGLFEYKPHYSDEFENVVRCINEIYPAARPAGFEG